ncbi:MAG TPA: hypothetical protein PL009_08140 [Flavipsychrobacter sp.]|nr:hypothetical protein [Flavipsychrobacter sp.]
MGKIVIARPNEWTNRAKKYKLKLDGEEIDEIKRHEIKEFDLSPGKHTITASLGWLSSNSFDFEISENETKYFKVSVSRFAGWWRQIGSVGILLYILVLRRVFDTEETVWETVFYCVLIFFCLLLVYDVSFGRKKHLWIRPDIK